MERPALQELTKEGLTLHCARSVNVLEFKRTYKALYSSPEGFCSALMGEMRTALAAKKIRVEETPAHLAAGLEPYADYQAAINEEVYQTLKPALLLQISDSRVANIITTEYNSGTGVWTSSESALVDFEVTLIDRESRQLVGAFRAEGEATVIFFAFKTALKAAVRNAARNSADYMATGKTEF
jgi:hypothetical protein